LSKLPTQLRWKLFVAAIKLLKYHELPSSGGSARHFQRGDEDPITFHEPHGNAPIIKQGTLTEYLRKLDISRDIFMKALAGSVEEESERISDEERFRRTSLANGIIVSNCHTAMPLLPKDQRRMWSLRKRLTPVPSR